MSTAAFTFYRGAWDTDCGNDCHGAEGHREGCPVHCYCYDDDQQRRAAVKPCARATADGHPDGLDMDLLAELVTDEGES